MPELPEVEALVRFLGERTVGRTVSGIEVGSIAALKTVDPPVTALVGGVVRRWGRHGKWLDLEVPDGGPSGDGESRGSSGGAVHLVFHLARGGWVRWSDKLPATPVKPRLGGAGKGAIIALRVRFDDGSGFDLTEAGTRKRLAVHVVRRPADVKMVASLGVDPLDPAFTADALAKLLASRNQQVKGLLREQSAIAGIGNAYSDEILHAARFSPFKLTRSFTEEETGRLHAATGQVLAEAIRAASGKPAKELKDAKRAGMRVHGRTGAPCPGWDGTPCGDTVHEVSFADRSLQYCPTCQTNGQILADRRLSRLLK
ncbi:Fpg/Nei family DNA glycosylase [Myceligenerans xiligouense]|uniref:Formamidopyrimidine-DNA glycosylase n=1 Tax=Myceligenerans xiligouense TaxID=253184 RepID=A0A3N4YNA5_9MICO|nr:DNA-formamidopyrimidine glycosylase family protein [Myceligenerans xiligouense]RPF22123.1 formamidopyrimidine-DNA glycosylase [Myceligenerans xiligouense]